MATQSQFIDLINTLANLVRSTHLKRALAAIDPDPPLNFWRVLHGHLLDMAVLAWCKLFGSDHKAHQSVHWKNVVADPQDFREALFKRLGINQREWTSYWKLMKRYRDMHVAHRDFRNSDVKNYPKLDYALESAYFYYEYILPEMRKHGLTNYPDDLAEYCARFADQAKEIAQKALSATADIKERVN